MSIISDTLQWLSKELYPTGRAFRVPENGVLYRLHRSLNLNFADAYKDATQILNDILPDSSLFTIDDAHDWYRRLGLYDSGTVSLDDMKLAITQKLSFPLTPLNKQNYLFIQQQLRAAGFDVYVYENRFSDGMGGYITKTPGEILGVPYGLAQYGAFQYGETDFGGFTDGVTKIANYIEESGDAGFVVGSNYKSTFYISSNSLTTFASVLAVRKTEFRQLLLKLKPLQTLGFLFINYV